MELIQVGPQTFYIKNATNIGIYQVDERNVIVIDTGNDQDAGKKILKIINEQGWQVQGIINTHGHADHIGGNHVIQERTGCPIYTTGLEKCFVEYPELESALLYGGCPFHDLRNKFLLAKAATATLVPDQVFDGLRFIDLPGHALAMVGVRTSDNIVFLADAILSPETITKYHIFYLYDVRAFLQTLDTLEQMDGALFIPSHGAATKDIKNLVRLHRDKIGELCTLIINCCQQPVTFEEILQKMFDHYGLTMNANQYVLVGSTVRSYLSYLCDEKKIGYEFKNNRMFWQQQ